MGLSDWVYSPTIPKMGKIVPLWLLRKGKMETQTRESANALGPTSMKKITIEQLDAPNAIQQIAGAVLENTGTGTWNATRSAAACGLVAAALFDCEPDDVRVVELTRIIQLKGIGCNNSGFAQWASDTPKGAAQQNVPGVIRQEKGKAQSIAVGGLLARLQAAGIAKSTAPEGEPPAEGESE